MTVGREDLEALTPESVAMYLREAGWYPSGDLGGRATIWEQGGQRQQIVVPVSSAFVDYPQRMYDIVRTLAAAEDRPEHDIVHSLAALPSRGPDLDDLYTDRRHFRLFSDAPSGMLTAADAAEAFRGVRETLIASAYAEHYPGESGLVLPSSKPRVVREFPERTLVTTGPGSFVITAHVLLPREDPLFAGPSFERLVMRRLDSLVRVAKQAAVEASDRADLEPFIAGARKGISRTLCQGLARLGGPDHNRPFELSSDWAAGVPDDLPAGPVRFEAEEILMLDHAAEDLGRLTIVRHRAEMRGKIASLDRLNPEDQGWAVVKGVLTSDDSSRVRKVWVPLRPSQYDMALRANGQGLEVRLAGVLTRTGRRTELSPSELFRVL